jgi:hypothetical protein
MPEFFLAIRGWSRNSADGSGGFQLKVLVQKRKSVIWIELRLVEGRHENRIPLKLNHLKTLAVPFWTLGTFGLLAQF